MKSKKNKIELLAPAGSPEKMTYAFTYGADAVYMGIPDFSLRVRINKFVLDDIKVAIEQAHKQGKKIYVTVNIYAHNEHLEKLPAYLKKLNEWQPDALIISDPGILNLAKKYAPKIPIHLSTQANATNWQAVKFWADQGVERVILGREVALEEIKEIHRRVPKVELEYFVHGAMCMSYSGRCMLSAWLAGRSANLGDCVQPCRWQYKLTPQPPLLRREGESDDFIPPKADERFIPRSLLRKFLMVIPRQLAAGKFICAEVEEPQHLGMKIPVEEDVHGTYIFNSKDLCLIEYLDELIDAGIVSFKIEGRAKSVAYLACVIKAYREGIDCLKIEKDSKKRKRKLKTLKKKYLDNLMSRGYTTGFLFGRDTVEQETKFSHIESEEEFVGEVVRVDAVETRFIASQTRGVLPKKQIRKIFIRPHNALKVGDKIRVIQPKNGTEFQFSLPQIYAENGEKVASAHGGTGHLVYIESKRSVEDFSILMKIK